MDHEKELVAEGKAPLTYGYGDEEKSGMTGHGSRRKIPPAEHKEGAEVQMEVGEKGRKAWVRFTIRGDPRRNPGKFWEYQLNTKKDGAQYSGDSYFPEEDVFPV